jgi:hypothetical protein
MTNARRTTLEILDAWLHQRPVTSDERQRLVWIAREILKDDKTFWPSHHFHTDN